MQSFKDSCRGVGVWFVRLEWGYKMFVLMTIACQIAGALLGNWSENMVFNPVMVVEQFQFWRLFSSILVVYELGVIPLLVTVFNLWICYICMPSLEKRYSTIYVFLELFKQTFVINLFTCILFYPLILMDLIAGEQIYMGGPIYSMLILLFIDCCSDSDGQFSICGFTFFLPKRYFPVMVLLSCFFFFRANIFMFGFIVLLLVYEFGCQTKPLFALPLCTYFKINQCIPESVRKLRGWVDCDGVRQNLEKICSDACQPEEGEEQNLVNSEVVVNNRKNIKHTGQAEYKHHWLNKEVPEPVISEPQMKEQPQKIEEIEEKHEPEVKAPVIEDYRNIWKSKSEDEPELDDHNQKETPPLISQNNQEQSQNFFYEQYNNPPEYHIQSQQEPEQPKEEEKKPATKAPQSVSAVVDDDDEWS